MADAIIYPDAMMVLTIKSQYFNAIYRAFLTWERNKNKDFAYHS